MKPYGGYQYDFDNHETRKVGKKLDRRTGKKNIQAELKGLFRRANADVLCTCNKPYWRHPMATEEEHLDWKGEPFLHRLCDNSLVKL